MHPILQNKFVRIAGVGLVTILVILFFLAIVTASLNDARNLGLNSEESYIDYDVAGAPMMEYSRGMNKISYEGYVIDDGMYLPPAPQPNGYTSGLETYETTSYSVTARTKQFDELCSVLKSLKVSQSIHFKNLNESTNNCNASFFVEESETENVLTQLTSFSGVEYTRNTSSVTRHKQQLESQTNILIQQLGNVQRSLTTAETQLNNLNSIYLNSEDVATLSLRVNESLRLIDQLTQRKINLTSQLDNLYQQSADLEERLGVVEFYVNVNRSNPIYPNQDSLKWEKAWDEVSDFYEDTLIVLSANFIIFLLWIVRAVIYILVIIVVLRGLYKFGKFVISKY